MSRPHQSIQSIECSCFAIKCNSTRHFIQLSLPTAHSLTDVISGTVTHPSKGSVLTSYSGDNKSINLSNKNNRASIYTATEDFQWEFGTTSAAGVHPMNL